MHYATVGLLLNITRPFSFLLATHLCHAAPLPLTQPLTLHEQSGFFRLSDDLHIQMPNNIAPMDLVGLHYYADLTDQIYLGAGGYGSIAGTQGGLFTLGFGGGLHHVLFNQLWGDVGLFVGGGGGKASLTGGGLMLKPYAGLAYAFSFGRVGAYYSLIDFPNGEIKSQQWGINFDLPVNIPYLSPVESRIGEFVTDLRHVALPLQTFFTIKRNDFSLLAQAYEQQAGTKNTVGETQDSTIGLVGAELDHYVDPHWFAWVKTSGAFHGIPNGYMDVLIGLGQHAQLGNSPIALVPMIGLGAGGGGLVETGGGFLLNALLGAELTLTKAYSLRVSSGYLAAPGGQLRVVPLTAQIIGHLDVVSATEAPSSDVLLPNIFSREGWRFHLFNQTYTHPQRTFDNTTTPIQLLGIQIDQRFTPWFFLSYQATGAYHGYHAGGYASGMIGPGIEWPRGPDQSLQPFAEMLIGAGGGGGLALSGGAIIEPVIGLRYALSEAFDAHVSAGELWALNNQLNTPVVNVGLTLKLDFLQADHRHPSKQLT